MNTLEAENQVIGIILNNSDIFHNFADELKPEMFSGRNKALYKLLFDMLKANEPIDIVTIYEKVKSLNKLDDIGGQTYINELALEIISTANYQYYVDIVKQNHIRTSLKNVLVESISNLTAGVNAEKVALEIHSNLYNNVLAENGSKDGEYLIDILGNNIDEIANDYDEYQQSGTISLKDVTRTGFKKLDIALTGGFRNGELVILGARSRVGKTAFALNLMKNIACNEKNEKPPIAFFELEMSNKQTGNRLLSISTGIEKSHFTFVNNLNEEKIGILHKKLGELSEKSPIKIFDCPSFSILEIETRARKFFVSHQRNGIIFIDHMQLINECEQYSDVQKVDNITRGLKTLAKRLDVPVILLCQLSRAVDSQTDKEPALKDLRGSAMIEANSDIVMLLHRQSLYEKTEIGEHDKALLKLDKVREGTPSRIYYNFEGATNKFIEQ